MREIAVVARTRFGMVETVFDPAVLLALTLGGVLGALVAWTGSLAVAPLGHFLEAASLLWMARAALAEIRFARGDIAGGARLYAAIAVRRRLHGRERLRDRRPGAAGSRIPSRKTVAAGRCCGRRCSPVPRP
jgi:hypothetical protein